VRILLVLSILGWGCSDSGDSTTTDGGSDLVLLFPGSDTGAETQEDAAPESDTDLGQEATEGCQCPPPSTCDDHGDCVSGCAFEPTTCASTTSLKVCVDDGASFEEVPCPGDQVCEAGVCTKPLCEANEVVGCDGFDKEICNSIGTGTFTIPCGGGMVCDAGECKPVAPNIIMLVDTSGSMNWMSNGKGPDDCFGGNCPPWNFPNCDSSDNPKTRLGLVKAALQNIVGSDVADDLRLALQRFPQVPFTDDDFFGFGPVCEGGYWEYSPGIVMTGDGNQKKTQLGSWFTQGIDEILPVPFPSSGATDLAVLGQWFDFTETVGATAGSCWDADQCGGGPCLDGKCHFYSNPELRAVGATPIGKSLFYAGEYLRHFVLVQGKSCQDDVDCGSPHHTCVDGACHDPFAECRPNVVIAFTDGAETQNVHIDDFFHPRVQAKRMHYGLGCDGDSDCLADATCVGSICRPPEGVLNEAALACETGGLPCGVTADCPDPCETFGGCQGYCLPAGVDVVDNVFDANVATDWSGNPVSVTIHVVDASGVPGANLLVARYGGGQHFSVDLEDPDALVSTFGTLLGDAKSGASCGGD